MTVSNDPVALKEQGNKAFKEHDWASAISFYTQAIDLNDKEPTFYTNRAQVRPHAPRHATAVKRLSNPHNLERKLIKWENRHTSKPKPSASP
jgi:serine/threonine-protein phosphatase 5